MKKTSGAREAMGLASYVPATENDCKWRRIRPSSSLQKNEVLWNVNNGWAAFSQNGLESNYII